MKNHWHSNNKQRQAAYKYGYRSGLELKVADQIKEAKYPVNYETETLKYIVPQKNSKYTPDFIFTKKMVIQCILKLREDGQVQIDKK